MVQIINLSQCENFTNWANFNPICRENMKLWQFNAIPPKFYQNQAGEI